MTYNTINNDVTMAGGAEGALLARRYRIVRQLGQGGMGSVWLAEDTQLDNKQFAIKMLPSILVNNKRAYNQLKSEALVAMKLVHPNIVQIRAFEENNGNPFLVMDYIDGETLDDYLAEKGMLAEDETLKLLKPIAAALDYAHGEGVVHRDVKPANVMIRKDGHPFILDFGISREMQETMTRVTGKLSSGTLLYMSPEQLRGLSPKPAQDVYSYAAMVYECLSGHPPFYRGAIEDQIKNEQPEPLDQHIIISGLVAQGLSKNPEDRQSNCAAVLECNASRRDARAQRGAGGQQASSTGSVPVRSGTWKIVVALAVIVIAAGGGLWWHQNEKEAARRHELDRIAEQKAEEKYKADEEARRIAAEKAEAERKAKEEEAARKAAEQKAEEERKARLAEEAEAAARKSATEIRIEAVILKDKVDRIKDEDGFKVRKDALSDIFARADALFDEKVRHWNEAAVQFTNYVDECNALIRLDGERKAATAAHTKAEESKKEAEKADAGEYSTVRWSEAVKLLDSANVEFEQMRFASAVKTFASAESQFNACAKHALIERRQRAEEAAAKAKAEQECNRPEAEAFEKTTVDRIDPKKVDVVLNKVFEENSASVFAPNVRVITMTGECMDGVLLKDGSEFIEIEARPGVIRSIPKVQVGIVSTKADGHAKTVEINSNRGPRSLSSIDIKTGRNYRAGSSFVIGEKGGVKIKMVGCMPGTFIMGSSDRIFQIYQTREKAHSVLINYDFWICATEITQKQWAIIMENTGIGLTAKELMADVYKDKNLYNIGRGPQSLKSFYDSSSNFELKLHENMDNMPIYFVSWFDADKFCKRLTYIEKSVGHRIPEGYEYRLPTEEEWEYACRAGCSADWPNGESYDVEHQRELVCPALNPIAWYKGNSNYSLHEAAGKKANRWGLYDMLGNVYEWCRGDREDIAPIRGGSFQSAQHNCLPSVGGHWAKGFKMNSLGFRVVLGPKLTHD